MRGGCVPRFLAASLTFVSSLTFVGLALVGATSGRAWADPALSVRVSLEPSTLGAGEVGRLAVEIDVPAGFHLWSLDPGEGPRALTIGFDDVQSPVLAFEGAWHGRAPAAHFDRGFERELFRYEGGTLRLERIVRVMAETAPGPKRIALEVRGQICTAATCIEQRSHVDLSFAVALSPSGEPPPSPHGESLTERKGSEEGRSKAAGSASGKAASGVAAAAARTEFDAARDEGVFSFMAFAFLFGLGALATPCVFPAIPLTVSFFSKYSAESFGRGARLAAFYALTMVATFTVAGVLISALFGATGIQRFAAHPVFNVILAVVLVFFSLNLLGLFEIRMPLSIAHAVNRFELRYGPNAMDQGDAKRSPRADYVVVAVAALTATTVFFTCTVGFVGLVLVAAARGEWFWPTVGMLAFSLAFALPFFLLALFPQAARRLKGRHGSWLNATRVTLGFFELAAATKFFSNADLVWSLGLLTRDAVLALWIPLFSVCGLYLLGKVHMGEAAEGTEGSVGRASVLQVLSASAMFSLSLYLTVGLFNGRPYGGWVDGWLPPLTYPSRDTDTRGVGLAWLQDLAEGRRRASDKHTLVFVNYTGYTCTNCRYMEGGVFPRPEIAGLLSRMTLVELYTDGSKAEEEANREDQVQRFGTAALPFYSIERSDGTVLATFPSSTNDPGEFERFLEGGLRADVATSGGVAAPARFATATATAAEIASQPDTPLLLRTTRLEDGRPEAAVVRGQWTLINFWATWCAPCREELKSFLLKVGADLEARGGRFAAVAVEGDDGVPTAREFMNGLGAPEKSSLRIRDASISEDVDPRLGFNGTSLPYTVLVSPRGEIVWRHNQRLDEAKLRAVLTEHTGHAALR